MEAAAMATDGVQATVQAAVTARATAGRRWTRAEGCAVTTLSTVGPTRTRKVFQWLILGHAIFLAIRAAFFRLEGGACSANGGSGLIFERKEWRGWAAGAGCGCMGSLAEAAAMAWSDAAGGF